MRENLKKPRTKQDQHSIWVTGTAGSLPSLPNRKLGEQVLRGFSTKIQTFQFKDILDII